MDKYDIINSNCSFNMLSAANDSDDNLMVGNTIRDFIFYRDSYARHTDDYKNANDIIHLSVCVLILCQFNITTLPLCK